MRTVEVLGQHNSFLGYRRSSAPFAPTVSPLADWTTSTAVSLELCSLGHSCSPRRAFCRQLELCYNAAAMPASVVTFSRARRVAKSNIGAMCHLHEIDDDALSDSMPSSRGVKDVRRL